MKRTTIFILLLTFFFCMIQSVQAVDPYASLKSEYINNHPNQTIIPFPWEPTTSLKVLPFNYEIPAAPGNNVEVTACPNQFESASFVITAQNDLSGINIQVTNLSDGTHTIPSSAVDIRTVKVWYQAYDTDIAYRTGMKYVLAPELLLKNDSIVRVNYTSQQNEVWLKNSTFEGYFHIDNTTIGQFPSDAYIFDNGTATGDIQPFAMSANENKQIWMTIHVPAGQVAGNYTGTITISSPSSVPVTMNFSVRILPFTLENSTLKYGLFYDGYLPLPIPSTYKIDGEKTLNQYTAELQDMKDHGVQYPTFDSYWGNWWGYPLEKSLSIRETMGFPKDMIFLSFDSPPIGNATDPAGLATIASTVTTYRNHTETYGYQNTYFYGKDEATGVVLTSQRTAWNTVNNNGGKMWVSSYNRGDLINNVGDILDVANLGYDVNSTEMNRWHNYGHKVFLYNRPQVGVENPEIYRRNYGFALWNSGYDGAMDFAYQCKFGQSSWNDFDTTTSMYRDHMFAYPTSNGVIDTVQWEGWREGVDDTRYVATLIKLEGSDTMARAIVSDSLAKGEDMATIREKIIAQILKTQRSNNEQTKVGVYQNGVWFWDINGNGILDDSEMSLNWGLPGDIPLVGDWNGDKKKDIGVFRPTSGVWSLDSNGNSAWEVSDKSLSWGLPGDTPVVGDWNGDGKDDLGIFRPSTGVWSLDSNGNHKWEVTDKSLSWGLPNDKPVIGDWNGDGKDDIGIFRPSTGVWSLDSNGNFAWEGSDTSLSWGLPNDNPVIGDWNGDGKDDIGIFRPSTGVWSLDSNGNQKWESSDISLSWGLPGDTPVIADWNGDGKDDIGIFRSNSGTWSLDSNGNFAWDIGIDRVYNFGKTGWTPVIGK